MQEMVERRIEQQYGSLDAKHTPLCSDERLYLRAPQCDAAALTPLVSTTQARLLLRGSLALGHPPATYISLSGAVIVDDRSPACSATCRPALCHASRSSTSTAPC